MCYAKKVGERSYCIWNEKRDGNYFTMLWSCLQTSETYQMWTFTYANSAKTSTSLCYPKQHTCKSIKDSEDVYTFTPNNIMTQMACLTDSTSTTEYLTPNMKILHKLYCRSFWCPEETNSDNS